MAERLKRNLCFIESLKKAKPKQRKAILETADRDLIQCLVECIFNVLNGNVKINNSELGQLKKHAKILRQLVNNNRDGIKKKKDILIQKGGFLPALLTPILGIAAGLLADLITRG